MRGKNGRPSTRSRCSRNSTGTVEVRPELAIPRDALGSISFKRLPLNVASAEAVLLEPTGVTVRSVRGVVSIGTIGPNSRSSISSCIAPEVRVQPRITRSTYIVAGSIAIRLLARSSRNLSLTALSDAWHFNCCHSFGVL